jgi:hypothetical protein
MSLCKKFYNKANNYGIVCTSINIEFTYDEENDKILKNIKFGEKIKGKYIKVKDENDTTIIHESIYDNSKNFVYCWMGRVHGGFIAIDIDCKTSNSITNYNSKIDNVETLTGTTPNGGLHYIYKLSDEQQKIMGDIKFGAELELFNESIDVIYNRGRIIMCGSAPDDEGTQHKYNITKLCEPTILPDIVFDEIIKRINGKIYSNKVKTKKGRNTVKKVYDISEKDVINQPYTETDKMLNRRLKLINVESMSGYCKWFSLCQSIKNSGGSIRLFIEFSKKTKYYDFDECVFKWNENDPEYINKCTLGTINYYAALHSPNKYRELIKNEYENKFNDKTLLALLNGLYDHYGDKSFADIMKHLYPKEYVYDDQYDTDKQKGTWFRCNEAGIYEECNNMEHAMHRIATDIHDIIKVHNSWYYSMRAKELTKNKISKKKQKPILNNIIK